MQLPLLAQLSLVLGVALFLFGLLLNYLWKRSARFSTYGFFIFSLFAGFSLVYGIATVDWAVFNGKFFHLQCDELWLIVIVGAVAANFEILRGYIVSLRK